MYLTKGLPGELYPAITLYSSANITKWHFGDTHSGVSNYEYSSAATLPAANIAKGVYQLAAATPESWALDHGLFTPDEYNTFTINAVGELLTVRKVEYAGGGGGGSPDLDGGTPSSDYGGLDPIDGGTP